MLVDSSGVLVKRKGTRGSGPGEYFSLDGVVPHEDGLLTWDAYHSRGSLLDSALEHVRDVQIPARAGNAVVGAPGNGVLMQVLERGFPGEGPVGPTETRRDMAFFIVDLRDGSMVLETSLPGSEVVGKREGTWHGSMPVLFGRRAVAAVAHGHAYLAVTDSLVLT